MSRNVVRGIFIPIAVKDLSEKARALSDGEEVKLSDCLAKFLLVMTI